MVDILANQMDEITALCIKHKVQSFSVFGSAARNSMTTDSDIDFLVQFSEEIDVLDYADNYFDFLEGLKDLTRREIDLVSVRSLRNPVLKEEINKTKVELYAA
jgi:predicted nucleotidyltransferase